MKSQTLTNEELQSLISEKIKEVSVPNANISSARVFFNGAKALVKSVSLDITGARLMGQPLFDRTRKFLGQ